MAFWMEIRCDGRGDSDHGRPDDQHCWSNDNADPQDMAGNSRASISRNIAHLHRMARSGGWRFVDEKWLCPGCLKRLGLPPGKTSKSRRDPNHYQSPKEIAKQARISMFPED